MTEPFVFKATVWKETVLCEATGAGVGWSSFCADALNSSKLTLLQGNHFGMHTSLEGWTLAHLTFLSPLAFIQSSAKHTGLYNAI